MGWNSCDCYGANVNELEVKENAKYEAKYLKSYGWNYIVVDYCWYYSNIPGNKINPNYQQRFSADGHYTLM